MPNETEKLIEEAQWYARRIGDYDGVPTELEDVLDGVVAALRLSQAERDAVLKQSAAWEIQAQDLRDRLVKAEAERDAQHDLVLRLTAERDEARVQLRAANDFLRVVTLERDHAQQVEVPDAFWRLDEEQRRVAELTATRDLLTAENARLQKERDTLQWVKKASVRLLDALSQVQWMEPHEPEDEQAVKAVRDWLSVSGLLVHAELLETIKDLRAQIAILELLRRGGK